MEMVAYKHNAEISSRETHFLKTKLVLTWLLEFRVSNAEMLSMRLNLPHSNTSRFFQNLIKKDLIQKFKNNHAAYNQAYFILTSTGKNYLQDVCCVDASHAKTSVSLYAKTTQLQHNIQVQKFILSKMDEYSEVICSHNIDIEGISGRPDALIKHRERHFWAAVEYEHWRKNKKRIYHAVLNHVDAMKKEKWSGVFYVFREKVDLRYYHSLLKEKYWPRYKINRNTGVITDTKNPFDADSMESVRRVFKMSILN